MSATYSSAKGLQNRGHNRVPPSSFTGCMEPLTVMYRSCIFASACQPIKTKKHATQKRFCHLSQSCCSDMCSKGAAPGNENNSSSDRQQALGRWPDKVNNTKPDIELLTLDGVTLIEYTLAGCRRQKAADDLAAQLTAHCSLALKLHGSVLCRLLTCLAKRIRSFLWL